MIRLFNDQEKKVLQTLLDKHIYASPLDIEASFIAGLDHQQAQLAALTAERDALQAKVDALILFVNGKITTQRLEEVLLK